MIVDNVEATSDVTVLSTTVTVKPAASEPKAQVLSVMPKRWFRGHHTGCEVMIQPPTPGAGGVTSSWTFVAADWTGLLTSIPKLRPHRR